MIFRTELKLKHSVVPISHEKPIFLLGSCFSDNIGSILENHKFQVTHNPFGITYNPISLAQQLKRMLSQRAFIDSDLFNDQGVFKSFELHSSQSSMDQEKLLSALNLKLKESHDRLIHTSHLFITLGTAWVYELKSSGQIVNNCHKIPSAKFNKRLLTSEEINSALDEIIKMIKEVNPAIQIIFTVSPVRHIRDGIENNSLSKSILRMAIHQMCENHKCLYFPASEILLDDLRDYRFYKSDLVHPNKMAVKYIWEKLSDVFIDQKTSKLIGALKSLRKALGHKAFHPNSVAYNSFIHNTIDQAKELQKRHSAINLDEEIKLLSKKLSE